MRRKIWWSIWIEWHLFWVRVLLRATLHFNYSWWLGLLFKWCPIFPIILIILILIFIIKCLIWIWFRLFFERSKIKCLILILLLFFHVFLHLLRFLFLFSVLGKLLVNLLDFLHIFSLLFIFQITYDFDNLLNCGSLSRVSLQKSFDKVFCVLWYSGIIIWYLERSIDNG